MKRRMRKRRRRRNGEKREKEAQVNVSHLTLNPGSRWSGIIILTVDTILFRTTQLGIMDLRVTWYFTLKSSELSAYNMLSFAT